MPEILIKLKEEGAKAVEKHIDDITASVKALENEYEELVAAEKKLTKNMRSSSHQSRAEYEELKVLTKDLIAQKSKQLSVDNKMEKVVASLASEHKKLSKEVDTAKKSYSKLLDELESGTGSAFELGVAIEKAGKKVSLAESNLKTFESRAESTEAAITELKHKFFHNASLLFQRIFVFL